MTDLQQGSQSELTNLPANVQHFMWNDDYIELLAHKLDLAKVRTLVDIGSGVGHISRVFGLYMAPGSTVHGFAPDALAVAEAQAETDANPFSVNFRFEAAEPHHLPLIDGAADLAVCQHVLIHSPDPMAALSEMCRVVRPGGRVVAFEPNRLAQSLILDSVVEGYTLDERLAQVRYQLYYECGKRLLGGGDDSIGDQLPRLFRRLGLRHIEVRLSDKTASLIPPYDTEEKQARVHELLSWLSTYESHREYIRKCFLTGGGTVAEYDAFHAWELAENERICNEIAREEFIHPGGMITYIVIGKK